MPCSETSSSISLQLDPDERLVNFDFAKITCGGEISAETGYSDYCQGKTVQDILEFTFDDLVDDLELEEEEEKFILYLEWDSLRCVIAAYLGLKDETIDRERCLISSIEHTPEGVEVALVILPPNEMPKILPCSLTEKYGEMINEN